ncbi:hypothetical protein AAMO2058_001200900 [Amorphochlora amoebiformis]
MGKKNKKDKKKKGKGMEKTMAKVAKKEQRRAKAKKPLNEDEDDIDAILAGIQEEERRKKEVKILPHKRPSPRIFASFNPHPLDKNKVIMFGGEYYDGKTDRTFGDLLVLNTASRKWSKIVGPGPLPRLAHQTATLPSRGGEMWMFGGHFNSPKQGFRHQNELWVLHLADYKWEKVDAKGSPTPRSGHRMVSYRNRLYVFGGYFDSAKTCLYYNDLFVFDTDTRKWSEVKKPPKSGPTAWPSERCGFNFVTWEKKSEGGGLDPMAVIYGGMRVENKKSSDTGITETDLWALSLPSENSNDHKYEWRRLQPPGNVIPNPRLGMGSVVHRDQLIFFGGVEDKETRRDLKGTHFNQLWFYNLETKKSGQMKLKSEMDIPHPPHPPEITKVEVGYQRCTVYFTEADGRGLPILSYTVVARPTGQKVHGSSSPLSITGLENGQKYTFFVAATNTAGKGPNSEPSEQVEPTALRETSLAPERLKLKATEDEKKRRKEEIKETIADTDPLSQVIKESKLSKGSTTGKKVIVDSPTPRFAAMTCLGGGGTVMYVFGGTFEVKAREYMFSDLYALDLNRREKWEVIHPINTDDQVWYGSDEDDDEDEDEDGVSASDSDGDEDTKRAGSNSLKVGAGESMKDYFSRTKEHWMKTAVSSSPGGNTKATRKLAFDLAQEAFKDGGE